MWFLAYSMWFLAAAPAIVRVPEGVGALYCVDTWTLSTEQGPCSQQFEVYTLYSLLVLVTGDTGRFTVAIVAVALYNAAAKTTCLENRAALSGQTARPLVLQESGPVEPLPRRPPAYYQYELKGVVVHSGTAFAGHYYSYIKARTFHVTWFVKDSTR